MSIKRSRYCVQSFFALAASIVLCGCSVAVNIGSQQPTASPPPQATPVPASPIPVIIVTATVSPSAMDRESVDDIEAIFRSWGKKVDQLMTYLGQNLQTGFGSPAFANEVGSRSASLQVEVDKLSAMKAPSTKTSALRTKVLAMTDKYTRVFADLAAGIRGASTRDAYALIQATKSLDALDTLRQDVEDALKSINDAKAALN